MHARVPAEYPAVAISVSPLSDNVMVIHVSGEYDYVYSCERKTEFITALSDQFMAMKKVALEVQFNSRIEYSTKNHQVREILFESDPSVGEDVVFDPVNTTLKVRVGKIPVVSAKQVEAKRRESHARQSTLQPEKRGLQKTLSNSPGITAFTPKGSEGPVNANAAALDTAVALYDFKAADSSEVLGFVQRLQIQMGLTHVCDVDLVCERRYDDSVAEAAGWMVPG